MNGYLGIWPDEDVMDGGLSCQILIKSKIWLLSMRLRLTYFKNQAASICEGEMVEAVTVDFTVSMAVLEKSW